MRRSDSLRSRLPPPRVHESSLSDPRSTPTFPPITANQILALDALCRDGRHVPSQWSIFPSLSEDLIHSLATDLDNLPAQYQPLMTALTAHKQALDDKWMHSFGDGAAGIYHYDSATTESTRIIRWFLVNSFGAISQYGPHQENPKCYGFYGQLHRPTWTLIDAIATLLWPLWCLWVSMWQHIAIWFFPGAIPASRLSFEVKALAAAGGFFIDSTLSIKSDGPESCILGIENKCPDGLPSVALELAKRGLLCRLVDVELMDTYLPANQPDWWVMANKGALYSVAYDTEWIVFAGTTAYTIAHRIGDHMIWSTPVYNRRDAGDEVGISENHPATLVRVFGDAPTPSPQCDLPLLFLSILIKAMAPHLPWLQQIFPTLTQLQFNVPTGEGQSEEFDRHGRDRLQSSDESRSDGGNDGNDHCISPIHDRHTPSTSAAPTTLVSGQHIFVGDWSGELAIPSGYIITIDDVLSDGDRGIVNVGSLRRNGVLVSALAIKRTEDTERLSREFSRYQALEKSMGGRIPHCFGFSIMHQTAFLVTELVRTPVVHKHCIPLLDQAERRAVYDLVRKLHNRGWTHNDLIDLPYNTVRNVLWSDTGRPVLIDLETVAPHLCSGRCAELRGLRKLLHLRKRDVAI